MQRTIVAVSLLAVQLVVCGAETAPVASPAAPAGETLLVRAGDSLVALDARSGRTGQRLAPGGHDAAFDAVYTAEVAAGATTVTATDPISGRRLRSIDPPERWAIPVAAGSTPEGTVSGEGSCWCSPVPAETAWSRFALLGTDLDAKPERFALGGRYDFDALAPDGSAVYLSEIEPGGHYRVRPYDGRAAACGPASSSRRPPSACSCRPAGDARGRPDGLAR